MGTWSHEYPSGARAVAAPAPPLNGGRVGRAKASRAASPISCRHSASSRASASAAASAS